MRLLRNQNGDTLIMALALTAFIAMSAVAMIAAIASTFRATERRSSMAAISTQMDMLRTLISTQNFCEGAFKTIGGGTIPYNLVTVVPNYPSAVEIPAVQINGHNFLFENQTFPNLGLTIPPASLIFVPDSPPVDGQFITNDPPGVPTTFLTHLGSLRIRFKSTKFMLGGANFGTLGFVSLPMTIVTDTGNNITSCYLPDSFQETCYKLGSKMTPTGCNIGDVSVLANISCSAPSPFTPSSAPGDKHAFPLIGFDATLHKECGEINYWSGP